MNESIKRRVLLVAAHILETGDTVRACAARFGLSKTTIHKDMRVRLARVDGELADRVGEVMRDNLFQRHLRGGEATRRRFMRGQNNAPEG